MLPRLAKHPIVVSLASLAVGVIARPHLERLFNRPTPSTPTSPNPPNPPVKGPNEEDDE